MKINGWYAGKPKVASHKRWLFPLASMINYFEDAFCCSHPNCNVYYNFY